MNTSLYFVVGLGIKLLVYSIIVVEYVFVVLISDNLYHVINC